MEPGYLGTLSVADPLYEILQTDVCPSVKDPVFHVDLISKRRVYKYTEEKSRTAIIGKFFLPDDPKPARAMRIKSEFEKLHKVRGYGFDASPHYVVRPISRNERIGLALVEEFISGKNLDHFIKKAIYEKNPGPLRKTLSRLASFLSAMHGRTLNGKRVDLEPVVAYYQKVLSKLVCESVISGRERSDILNLVEKWLKRPRLLEGRASIVHGDATPTNFLFTENGDVVAIDLERMKDADAIFDAGMVCGELKHAFLWRTGNAYAAEPYISHFLSSYCTGSGGQWAKQFRKITTKNPFYMALAELRIARNGYLGRQYRRDLAQEARQCLKWGLKI